MHQHVLAFIFSYDGIKVIAVSSLDSARPQAHIMRHNHLPHQNGGNRMHKKTMEHINIGNSMQVHDRDCHECRANKIIPKIEIQN
jgi:hypothetical protein